MSRRCTHCMGLGHYWAVVDGDEVRQECRVCEGVGIQPRLALVPLPGVGVEEDPDEDEGMELGFCDID